MNALHAERMVLGNLLHACPVTSWAIGDLPAAAFCCPAHRAVFWCLLVDSVQPDADPDLAAALADVGGVAYLDELTACSIPDSAPETVIADACSLIRRNWIERRQLDAEDAERLPYVDNVVWPVSWSAGGLL